MKFKDYFDQMVKEKKKKLIEIHEETGISTSYLTDIRKGRNIPSEEKLEKIIKSLQLEEEERKILKKAWLTTKTPVLAQELDIESKREKELKKVIDVLRKEVKHNKIPYFEDIQASAGFGCFCENNEENICEYIEVPSYYAKNGNIAINVNGDSMEPEFHNNDIIVIDTKEKEFINKKFAVVFYQDMVYLKKIVFEDENIFLESINPYYPKKVIDDPIDLKIIGKVVYSCRKYK